MLPIPIITLDAVKVHMILGTHVQDYEDDEPEDVAYFTTDDLGSFVGWMSDDEERFPEGDEDIAEWLMDPNTKPGKLRNWELREFTIDFTKLPWHREIPREVCHKFEEHFVAVYYEGQCLGLREMDFYPELEAIQVVVDSIPIIPWRPQGEGTLNGLVGYDKNSPEYALYEFLQRSPRWTEDRPMKVSYPEVYEGWELRVYTVDFTEYLK